MLKQILSEGLSELSNSPFSSLVFFVKKKDFTWWFCKYYKALHAMTVKEAFLIPIVEELLDELFGASFFFQAWSLLMLSPNPSTIGRSL